MSSYQRMGSMGRSLMTPMASGLGGFSLYTEIKEHLLANFTF